MRKLARIERIDNIEPIEGADRIETAVVDGWKVVVSKDEGFSKGDLVVFFEVDAYLPIEPRYEFLRKYSYKKLDFKDGNPEGHRTEGFRLKTVRLRGVYSQGLVMPLTTFEPEIKKRFGCTSNDGWKGVEEGADLTADLDVKLFVKPIPMEQTGIVKGNIPFSIPVTEQERIQNLPEYFEEMEDIPFEETEKINGMSMTVYWKDGKFGVCKRNWELKEDDRNIMWRVARNLDLERALEGIGMNVALQGELAGEGIQGNTLGLAGQSYFLFDAWDIDNRRYLTGNERAKIFQELQGKCDIKHVPVINEEIKIFEEYSIDKMDDLISRASGKSLVTKGRAREGIVFKSTKLVNGQTASFKVVDNKYLLKHGG